MVFIAKLFLCKRTLINWENSLEILNTFELVWMLQRVDCHTGPQHTWKPSIPSSVYTVNTLWLTYDSLKANYWAPSWNQSRDSPQDLQLSTKLYQWKPSIRGLPPVCIHKCIHRPCKEAANWMQNKTIFENSFSSYTLHILHHQTVQTVHFKITHTIVVAVNSLLIHRNSLQLIASIPTLLIAFRSGERGLTRSVRLAHSLARGRCAGRENPAQESQAFGMLLLGCSSFGCSR